MRGVLRICLGRESSRLPEQQQKQAARKEQIHDKRCAARRVKDKAKESHGFRRSKTNDVSRQPLFARSGFLCSRKNLAGSALHDPLHEKSSCSRCHCAEHDDPLEIWVRNLRRRWNRVTDIVEEQHSHNHGCLKDTNHTEDGIHAFTLSARPEVNSIHSGESIEEYGMASRAVKPGPEQQIYVDSIDAHRPCRA